MTERTTTPPVPTAAIEQDGSAVTARDADVRGVGVTVRLVAYLLDALLVGLAIYAVVWVLHALVGPTARIAEVDGVPRLFVDRPRIVVDTAVATAVSGAYFAGSWLTSGRTPAQRLFGLRVERADGGGRLSLGATIRRWLMLGAPFGLLSTLLLPATGLAAILLVGIAAWHVLLVVTTARDRHKRGLHDRVAGSIVRRRRGASA